MFIAFILPLLLESSRSVTMSAAEYEIALPGIFPKSEVGQVEEESQPALPRVRKGFADIIEYHSETLAGKKTEIIPVSRLIPKHRKTSKNYSKYEDYAVVLRRTWVQKGKVSVLARIELEIQSKKLCEAFRNIAINTYEGTDLDSFPIKINCPFSELFFYRDEIKGLANNDPDENVRRQARILYEFVTDNGLMSSVTIDHEKYYNKGQVVSDILWTIYPPNSILVVKVGMIQECWICRNVSIRVMEERSFWVIEGFRVGYDGSSLGMVRQTFYIPLTTVGLCKISDLPIVPLEKYEDRKALEIKLALRGINVQKMLGNDFNSFSSKQYTGAAWGHEFSTYSADFNPQPDAKQIEERVLVDFKAYLDAHPRRPRSLETFNTKSARNLQPMRKAKARGAVEIIDITPTSDPGETDDKSKNKQIFFDPEGYQDPLASRVFPGSVKENEDSENQLNCISHLSRAVQEAFHISEETFKLLFPALVPAFGLRNKNWWWLVVDDLKEVTWNTAAFETLQLDPGTKDLVQCLVKGHKHKSVVFDDVMSGKGQGLIFLLHGNPGLGKTLTAESVAEDLNRPLYSISGGELSTDVTVVERKLNEIFDLAKRWNAVCLLDEADVLLCKRNSAEIDRNAIVAVFLRKLEYFQSVLILTTNRKEDFDDAFKSRIHITITFPDLSPESRSKIWRGLIDTNTSVERDQSWTDQAFKELGLHEMNGRTIKNILRTAVAYANAKNEPLGIAHVDVIVQTELAESKKDLSESKT
ncbi:P-loop containing nucleoside triphosphate hydrolase protein [Xylaria telfairii]|nr:P-loop containing nucleoside triphosphate hydrolase protein [Xylaria telfairii]